MSQATRYAIKIVALSALFIPINIAALMLLQEALTWWKVSLVVGALALADIIFIVAANQSRKPSKTNAKHSSKSTHEPR